MKREDKYLVIKRADIGNYLTHTERSEIRRIENKIRQCRIASGKADTKYVCVADSWPMYEQVWGLIESWVDKTDDRIQQLKEKLDFYDKQYSPKYGHPDDWPHSIRVEHLALIAQLNTLKSHTKPAAE